MKKKKGQRLNKQLDKASLHTVIKRFLAIFLPVMVLLVSIFTVLIYEWNKDERSVFEHDGIHGLELGKERIIEDFHLIVSDLIFLSNISGLPMIGKDNDPGAFEELSQKFLIFCRSKEIYNNVRLLNETGMEVIRIDFNNGSPHVIPNERLQSKTNKDYFKDTFSLDEGGVYISPFGLNFERGKIEQPLKPIIRFGTPVVDHHGRKRGVLILNYLGEKLLQDIKKTFPVSHHTEEKAMFLNSDGYWLYGPSPEDEWGFIFEDRKDRTFGKVFPEAWQRIKEAELGQFYDSDGAWFTFNTVYPLLEARKSNFGLDNATDKNTDQFKSYYWKIIYYVPPEILSTGSYGYWGIIIIGILVIPLIIGCWFLALAGVKRKQAEKELQKAYGWLEAKVKERTAELTESNEQLKHEITDRKWAEEALQNALTEVDDLKNRFQAENIYLQDEIKVEHNFEEIISRSKEFSKVLRKVEQVAPTTSTVLILGETGTGKELLARAIHNTSNRKDRPLVKVDCAALPANLIESELFGHEKGAFTGAGARKIGRFELADGGTVFLDEIGDLPLGLQAKLLRILQEGEFERLGSVQTLKVDVRVIAATNRNLEKIVDSGHFREDLYYRLNVFPIKTSPLRDRKDDIPMLVNHFIKKYSAKIGKEIESIPQNVMDTLQTYHWPGNVRELENIIERAVVLNNCPTLRVDDLSDRRSYPLQLGNYLPTLKENERFLIIKALEVSNWVIEGEHGAAARLDIAPSTLRDRMKKYSFRKPIL